MEFRRYQNSQTNQNNNNNNIVVVINADNNTANNHPYEDDDDDDDDEDDDEDIGEIDDDFFKQLDAEATAKVRPSLSKETKKLLLPHIPPILRSNSMNLIPEHGHTSTNVSNSNFNLSTVFNQSTNNNRPSKLGMRNDVDEGEIIESNRNNENYRKYDNFHSKHKSSGSSSSSSSHKHKNQYNRNSNEYFDRNENANRSSIRNSSNYPVESKRNRPTPTFPTNEKEIPNVVIYDQQIVPEPIDDTYIYNEKCNQRGGASSTHEKIIEEIGLKKQQNSTLLPPAASSEYENYDINPEALEFLKNMPPNSNVIDKKKYRNHSSGKIRPSLSKKAIDAMSNQLMANAINRVRQSLTLIEGNEKNIRLLRYLYTSCCTNSSVNSTMSDNKHSIVQSNKNLSFKYSSKLNIYSDDDDDDDDDDVNDNDGGERKDPMKSFTEDDIGIDIVTEHTKKFIKLFGFDYLLIKNKLKLMRSALLKKDQTENGEIPEISDEDLSEATFNDDVLDNVEHDIIGGTDDNDNESAANTAIIDVDTIRNKRKIIDGKSEEEVSSQQKKSPIEMLRKQIAVNLLPKLTIAQLNAIIDFSNIIQSLPKNKNDIKFVYDNVKDIIDYLCYDNNNELNVGKSTSTTSTKLSMATRKSSSIAGSPSSDININNNRSSNSLVNIPIDINPIPTIITTSNMGTSTIITTSNTATKPHEYFDDGHISDTLSLNASIHSDDEDRRTQQEIEGIRKQLSLKDDEFRKKKMSILNLEKEKQKTIIELYSDHNVDDKIIDNEDDDDDDLENEIFFRRSPVHEGERLFSTTSLDNRRRRQPMHHNNRFNSPGGGGGYNNNRS